jgi:hypothetical protein
MKHSGGLFARILDKSAGVHQTDIRIRRFLGNHPAAFNETTENQLRVDGVFGAAQGNERNDGGIGWLEYWIAGLLFLHTVFFSSVHPIIHHSILLPLPEAGQEENEHSIKLKAAEQHAQRQNNLAGNRNRRVILHGADRGKPGADVA